VGIVPKKCFSRQNKKNQGGGTKLSRLALILHQYIFAVDWLCKIVCNLVVLSFSAKL
jgi:hypothetical protein